MYYCMAAGCYCIHNYQKENIIVPMPHTVAKPNIVMVFIPLEEWVSKSAYVKSDRRTKGQQYIPSSKYICCIYCSDAHEEAYSRSTS